MSEEEFNVFLHNMRGELTVIKNAISFVLEGRTGTITDQTKELLKEVAKRNEKLIQMSFVLHKGETNSENTTP